MKQINLTLYNQNIWGNMGREERISNRNGAVRAMILAYDADICCFQECNPKTSRAGEAAIVPLLADVYEEVPTSAGADNFTPIFYRRSRFDVVESSFTAFEGLNDIRSKSITWAIFSEKESGVRFGICCTHFWWQDGEESNTQRLENAAVLLAQVEELKARYDVPVFACGDLNCGKNATQGDEPYRWLRDRLLDVRLHAPVTTDALTVHPYPVRDADNLYHAAFGPFTTTIDHCFVCDHPHVRLNRFTVDQSPVAQSSSDHCPLIIGATILGE